MNVDDVSPLEVQLVEQINVALLEERGQLNIALLRRDLHLNLAVRVVDNGDEHVQEDEEHEEHVGEEKYGP